MDNNLDIKNFSTGIKLLEKTIQNHKNLQNICENMDIILEDGYFNVIATMCEHIFEFQDRVLKMLLEAKKNIKPNIQQKPQHTPSKNKTQTKAQIKAQAKAQKKAQS